MLLEKAFQPSKIPEPDFFYDKLYDKEFSNTNVLLHLSSRSYPHCAWLYICWDMEMRPAQILTSWDEAEMGSLTIKLLPSLQLAHG